MATIWCWWLNWLDTSGWKPHAATAYLRRQIARRRWKDSRWTTNARTFSDRCGTGAPDTFSSRGAPRRSRQRVYPVAKGHYQGLTAPRSTDLPWVRLADLCSALPGLCAG